ncbi:MAG: pilus assembly protein [Hyphomonadaceae bacterium]|nr:pilus assembly protein [Hyphomonadaceae bacterium]
MLSAFAERTARGRRSWRGCASGVSAVEFAMLAPIFMVMVFASLQIALAWHNGNTVRHAVKKAARELMFDKTLTEDDLQVLVDARLAKLRPAGLSVDIALAVDTSGSVPVANVTGTYTHPVQIPMFADYNANFDIDLVVLQPAD